MTSTAVKSLDEILHHCIHCGMCLPVCPTYNLTFNERSSPRGRIRLIKSVRDGMLKVSSEFVDEMFFCLDCQACQTACPAGVLYGALVEEARSVISQQNREPWNLRFLKSFLLKTLLASKSKTKFAARLLRFYQKIGVKEAVEQSGILKLFSERLHEKHALLPKISDTFFDETVDEVICTTMPRRGRVALLYGCIMNVAFADVHSQVAAILLAKGFDVIIPKQQVCCGSLHAHYGELEVAKQLARTNIGVFQKFDFDTLVVDSAGCSAFMKDYGKLLADDVDYRAKAEVFSQKVKDITEFLVEIGFEVPTTPFRKRVTYHEACHLVHTQKISQQPRVLLQSIPGIEFVELPEATWCCGSAGIYNVVRYDDSMKLLERKINNLKTTNADIVVTANPGCHLQLEYGIKKFGLKMEVMHLVQLFGQVTSS